VRGGDVQTLFRFACVGGTNLVVDLLLFNGLWALLGHRAGVALGVAALVAYALTTGAGYLANRAWSFRQDGALWRYLVVYGASGLVTAVGLPAAQQSLVTAAAPILATSALKVAFALTVAGINYAGLRWFVFGAPEAGPAPDRRHILPPVAAPHHSVGG
jgi:putative flippase GtrA